MKKVIKVLLVILIIALALYLIGAIVNFGVNQMLRSYIKSFEPVAYSAQKIPEKDGEYYCFKTDDDLKVMHITDFHLGGGFWTIKEDKKAIYEVITMLQKEKPDLVILGGDNVFCVPGPVYNGGFTLNNKMVSQTVMTLFEHEQVYFSTVFGNHDTESFDYYSREQISKTYQDEKFKYCIFAPNFRDPDASTIPSESNQFILVENTKGEITKLILLIDTNAYVDTSIQATIDWLYDTIHPAQVEWASDTIRELSKKAGLPDGKYLKTHVYMHIPVGEYQEAFDDMVTESKHTQYISGDYADEGIFYGGYSNEGSPASQDNIFEVLHDNLNSLEAMYCGHDHLNNAVLKYKGVYLSYGYSIDNIAYGSYMKTSGLQRGATVITYRPDGSFKIEHKNAYKDYGCSTDKFFDVRLDSYPIPVQVVDLSGIEIKPIID